ncbi:hypothetical protein AB0K05_38075 [Nonomuraea sp. NPDC049486]|uniref:hypothetical protein n=1 Tax=Nonomuraea sp. NPDC049486 TaxID=3155773 RepID=UPI00343F4A9F
MSIPPDLPTPAPPPESRRSRTARRIGCLAVALVPLLLLAAIVKAPAWIDDHRLARMVDRIQEYPPPAGADLGYFDRHVEVSGDSGDCWYTIRFELSTDRPIQEVLNHYRQAKIEDPDGDLGDYELVAYTPFDESGTPVDGTSATNSMILHLDGMYDGTWLDMRCY